MPAMTDLQEIRQQLDMLNINVKIGQAQTANPLIRLRNRFIYPSCPENRM